MRTAITLLICILLLPACSGGGEGEPAAPPQSGTQPAAVRPPESPQPEAPKPEAATPVAEQDEAPPPPAAGTSFRWGPEEDGTLDLFDGDRRVLRYMFKYDRSTPEAKELTYKVYHHVYDETGENLLTKGPGGLYSHHRGLFLGFNKLRVGEQEYDFWHMKDCEQAHAKNLSLKADENGARQIIRLLWSNRNAQIVISERRMITVHRTHDDALLLADFECDLAAMVGDLELDGDPEHAGFQFRAHNDVNEGPEEVKAKYLFHEDGIDPHEVADLPWAAMSFGLNGKRYSVVHMNHPSNPKPTMYSAYRDYGRFGAFPKASIRGGTSLTLRYRIRVAEGDLPSREECQRLYDTYVAGGSGS
jgi:hypothetical protein